MLENDEILEEPQKIESRYSPVSILPCRNKSFVSWSQNIL